MKAKIVERLFKESISNEDLKEICSLIGEAHDKILDAQDRVSDIKYDEYNSFIDELDYALEDIEYAISEYDFMGYDDPVKHLKDKLEFVEDEDTSEEEDVEFEECKK